MLTRRPAEGNEALPQVPRWANTREALRPPAFLRSSGPRSQDSLIGIPLRRLDRRLLEMLPLHAQVVVVVHHHDGRGVPQQLGDLGHADRVLQGVLAGLTPPRATTRC